MTNLSNEELKKRAELLKVARQLVNKEYIDRRVQQHQLWITNSETSWRTNGALLPYPPGILYPSEDEVVAKALELYNATAETKVQQPTTLASLPLPEVPPISAATFNPDINTAVTAQLQAVSANVATTPIDTINIPASNPSTDHLQPTPTPEEVTTEPETIIEPTPEEPTITSNLPEINQDTAAKHSLLRNVLSGWLQKNKDKEN